jgi:chaperonin GroES
MGSVVSTHERRVLTHRDPFNRRLTHMTTAAATKILPLADRIVVKPLEETEQKRGALYIPDTAKEKPQQGEVVAVGPGKVSDEGKRIAPEVKEGDRVLYGKYSGTEVNVGDEQYLILRETDVLAILKS